MEDMCPLLTSGAVPAGRARGGPERLAAAYARPGEATAWAVPNSKPGNRGRSELTTDKTGFRRIGTEALERENVKHDRSRIDQRWGEMHSITQADHPVDWERLGRPAEARECKSSWSP